MTIDYDKLLEEADRWIGNRNSQDLITKLAQAVRELQEENERINLDNFLLAQPRVKRVAELEQNANTLTEMMADEMAQRIGLEQQNAELQALNTANEVALKQYDEAVNRLRVEREQLKRTYDKAVERLERQIVELRAKLERVKQILLTENNAGPAVTKALAAIEA